MKKIASYIGLLLLALIGLASCNGDYAQPPMVLPEGGIGNGNWDSPISVIQILGGKSGRDVWVKGYIVGWIDTSGGTNNVCNETTCTFTVPATLQSNMLMAASPDEKDWTKCIPVQLGGSVRTALNLQDHPENLGKLVCIKANVERYFGIDEALKNPTAYKWGDLGIEEDKPGTGDDPGTGGDTTLDQQIYASSFADNNPSGFTFDQGELPSGISYVWSATSQYGLKATAFVGGTRYQTEAWAVSPELDLTDMKDAAITFNWAGNFFNDQDTMKKMCSVAVREGSGAWKDITVSVWPSGSSWNFEKNASASLRDYCGKKVQVGFRYSSTSSVCGTLEVDHVVVKGAKK